MAQCHTDGRKHPSAMDMYVGVLHSKLYSPNKEDDNYPCCPRYNAATNRSSERASESFRTEPTSNSRSSFFGSFGEDPFKTVALPTVDPGHEVKPLKNGYTVPLDNTSQKNKAREILSQPADLHHGRQDKPCLTRQGNMGEEMLLVPKDALKVSNARSHMRNEEDVSTKARGFHTSGSHLNKSQVKSPCSDNALVPSTSSDLKEATDKKSGDLNGNKNSNGLEKCQSFSERTKDHTRNHKSAELTVEITSKGRFNVGHASGARLFKSGEQFGAKGWVNGSNIKENPHGSLNMGSLKLEGNGFVDSLSVSGCSPTANKDGRRWPSFGSQGSVDSVGGSPTAKDGGRRSSFSNGGSSDSGSPMAKDVWRRSSTGGYGSADSSGSSVGSPTAKDAVKRVSAGNVLNNKEFPTSARGMGNIFGSGNIHGNSGRAKISNSNGNGNEFPKSGDGPTRKLDNTVPLQCSSNLDHPKSRGCLENSSNGNLGYLFPGNRNVNASSGNILSYGMTTQSTGKLGVEGSNTPNDLSDPEDIKKAGNEEYKNGHFLEAVALYNKCIALCPDHAPYRSNKAAALIGLGRLGEAVQECEDAIRLDSRYTRAHQRVAHLYLRLGLIESAKRHFQAAGQQADVRDVQSLQAIEKHISRCIEARKVGDWRCVLRESTAAIAAGADSAPQVLSYKSEALLKLHQPMEAEVLCTEAQRLESSFCKPGLAPADSFLHILRAHIEMALGRFDGAIAAAHSAAKIDPRNPEAIGLLRKARAVGQTRTLGNKYFNAGKFFEACAAYGEGLESDPTNAVLLCNRAACRSKLGQWEKAIEDCDAALLAQPKYIKALMRRANCSLKLERWEDALRDYEALRREMPGDMEVARGLFDAQVAIKKARGEEVYKMKFGKEVEEVLDNHHLRDAVTSPGLCAVHFFSKRGNRGHQISPFFDQLCKQYPCVHFLKVDVDENPYVASTDSVSFVPTIQIFNNGQKMREIQSPSQQEVELAIKQYS